MISSSEFCSDTEEIGTLSQYWVATAQKEQAANSEGNDSELGNEECDDEQDEWDENNTEDDNQDIGGQRGVNFFKKFTLVYTGLHLVNFFVIFW